MQYDHYRTGIFFSRPNRFIAEVECGGEKLRAHVKNTGRCRELLVPGCKVGLAFSDRPERRTPCDLVQTEKLTPSGPISVNMDSQAPNQLTEEFLQAGRGSELFPHITGWKREVTTGDSRLDFRLDTDDGPIWMEVKGCTLEQDGLCRFPDAPTLRGTKHMQTLRQKALSGERAAVFFVIQLASAKVFSPNRETDPRFSDALKAAYDAGVAVFAYACSVGEGTCSITHSVPVLL